VRSFTLVDLVSQAEYIPRDVRAWPRERILAWLAQYGEVWRIEVWPIPVHLDDGNDFFFRSWIGCETGFRLTEDGSMALVGDHFMVPVWDKRR